MMLLNVLQQLNKIDFTAKRLKGRIKLKRLQDHRLCFAGWFYADEKTGLTSQEY